MGNEFVFYSTDEVADMLKVSKRTVFRFIHGGQLHALKIGHGWKVSQEDLSQFLQTRERR